MSLIWGCWVLRYWRIPKYRSAPLPRKKNKINKIDKIKLGNASLEQTSTKFPSGLGPTPIIQKFLTLDKHILKYAGNMVGAQEVFGE